MRLNYKRLLIVAAVFVLAACESISAVKPGGFAPNKDYQVEVGKTWTAFPKNSRTKLRNLTIDGLTLNQLTFGASIEDGEAIVQTAYGDREKLVPKFRSDMGPFEITEFVTDSLTAVGIVRLETSNLRPDPFGTLEGVRFDFTGASASGLNYTGTAKTAVEDGKLHLILYYAPSEYYYGLHKDEVERILASVTLI